MKIKRSENEITITQMTEKIHYLQSVVKNYEQENIELKELNHLNKAIIYTLQQELKSQFDAQPNKQHNQQILQLNQIVNKIMDDNLNIQNKVNTLTKERENLQSQLFLTQQLLQASKIREEESINDLQQKIILLKEKLKSKEKQRQNSKQQYDDYYTDFESPVLKTCAQDEEDNIKLIVLLNKIWAKLEIYHWKLLKYQDQNLEKNLKNENSECYQSNQSTKPNNITVEKEIDMHEFENLRQEMLKIENQLFNNNQMYLKSMSFLRIQPTVQREDLKMKNK